MHDFIEEIAKKHGFSEIFFAEPKKIDGFKSRAEAAGLSHLSLYDDAGAAYPRAKSLVLMLYPYKPFEKDTRLSAYYIASNKAYHAAKEVVSAVQAASFYAESARIPLRAAFLQNNIGAMSKNGLLRYADYGSRIILAAIVTDAAVPKKSEIKPTRQCEENCTACTDACPVSAIGENGLVQKKCMRYYMDDVPYPDFVLENIEHYMGCEICMHACRENALLEKRCADADEVEAFDTERLAGGDDAAARRMVGKNFTRHSKLVYEAENFIKRTKNTTEGNKNI